MVASRPPRAVLRLAKVKSMASLDRRSRHTARTQPVENDDPDRGGVVWLTASHDPAAAVRAGLAILDGPPRKNAVLAVEAIVSASPAWFGEGANRQVRADAFSRAVMTWATAEFGAHRIMAAARHDGEATPHVHLWLLPVAEKAVRTRGRKPKDGQPRPARGKRTLDFAGLWGRPGHYQHLQDTIGTALSPLGILRGERKPAPDRAKHKEFAAWKAEERAAMEAARHARAAVRDDETRAAVATLVATNEAKAARADRIAASYDRIAAGRDRRDAAADLAEQRRQAEAWGAGLDAFGRGELVGVVDDQGGGLRPVFADIVPAVRRREIARQVAPVWDRLAEWLAAFGERVGAVLARAEKEAAAVIRAADRISRQAGERARVEIAVARQGAQRQPRERGREL